MIKRIAGKTLDIKPNEIRYRLKAPDNFNKGSFRRKVIGDGVSLIIACPEGKYQPKKQKCKVGTQRQAVRFSRDRFTPAQAVKWIERNGL